MVKTREQRATLEQVLVSSRRALQLSTTRYREGYSDFQRVLEAQRTLAAQSANYVANRGTHINAVITFYKALGGGWQAMSVDEMIPAETLDTMKARTNWGEMLDSDIPAPAS